jgi:uncharacterized membrane protein YqhA
MENDAKDTIAGWLIFIFFGGFFFKVLEESGHALSIGNHLDAVGFGVAALIVAVSGLFLLSHFVHTSQDRSYYQKLYEESHGQVCHYHPCEYFQKWEEDRKKRFSEAKAVKPSGTNAR